MAEASPVLVDPPEGYAEWLSGLKSRVYAAQQRAALAVNTEMLGPQDHRTAVAGPSLGLPRHEGLLPNEP